MKGDKTRKQSFLGIRRDRFECACLKRDFYRTIDKVEESILGAKRRYTLKATNMIGRGENRVLRRLFPLFNFA